MKVILFTLEYPPFKGGVAEYYRGLKENWLEPDEISVLTCHCEERSDAAIPTPERQTRDRHVVASAPPRDDRVVRRHLVATTGWPRWLPAIFALRAVILNGVKNPVDTATRSFVAPLLRMTSQPHVIVGQILPLGTVVLLLNLFRSKKNKIPYTVILHGQDINYAFRFKRKRLLAELILKQAKNIICNSHYTAEIVMKHFGARFNGKLKVVNPGIEPKVPHLTPRPPLLAKERGGRAERVGERFILFSLGRLVKRKGVDMTIEAMVKLVKKIPNIEYYFAGDGPDKQYLLGLIKMQDKSLQKKIHYLGKISEAEKWAWLRRTDIFCQPTRDINGDVEGFGIVYLEAGLAGTPVIAGRGTGSDDAVEDYETGILVDGKYPDDIMEAVLEMHRKPALRAEMGEEGTRRVLKDFSWKEKARQVYRLICNL